MGLIKRENPIIEVRCKVCKKNFRKFKKPRRRNSSGKIRSCNRITCSKRCSRIWIDKYRKLRSKIPRTKLGDSE